MSVGLAYGNHKQIEKKDKNRITETIKTVKNNGYSWDEEVYLRTRLKVIKAAGVNAAGRNIVMDGKENGKTPSDALIKSEIKNYKAILAPAPETVVTESAPTTTTTTESSGGYAIPEYIVECESGGDYSAQNPSGAYGAYQIMPGTASAYGCDLSTPAGQDACAAEIYATEGASPWACG